MTDALEQQADELEALISIYEGDTFFKQLDNKSFQYKVSLPSSSFQLQSKYLTIFTVWR